MKNNKEGEKPKDAVARVNDKYLFKDEISRMLTPGTSKEDSILLARNFIQNWIKQQVILQWDPLESTCRHASLSIL